MKRMNIAEKICFISGWGVLVLSLVNAFNSYNGNLGASFYILVVLFMLLCFIPLATSQSRANTQQHNQQMNYIRNNVVKAELLNKRLETVGDSLYTKCDFRCTLSDGTRTTYSCYEGTDAYFALLNKM